MVSLEASRIYADKQCRLLSIGLGKMIKSKEVTMTSELFYITYLEFGLDEGSRLN